MRRNDGILVHMMVMVHVLIAAASLLVSLATIWNSSRQLQNSSYGLAAATVASGILLGIVEPAQMTHTCMSGLAYLMALGAIAYGARQRAAQQLRQQKSE